jgi:hypothetical protein
MSGSSDWRVIDPSVPKSWILISDGMLLLCFFAPALNLAWYFLRQWLEAQGYLESKGSGAPHISPTELEARAGAYSQEQRERDRAANAQLHQDALSKAQGSP